MNPTANFPVECLDDIFRHLKGKDLLKCTLVCPGWNNFISTTTSCMQKISLTYDYQERNLGGLTNILMNCKRKYKCLSLDGDYSEDMQQLLSEDGRTWTRIDLIKLSFQTTKQFLDFLRIFQSSVQELLLPRLYINKDDSFHSSDDDERMEEDERTEEVYDLTDLQFPSVI